MDFTRCYGCMRELEAPGAVCPHCGYDNTNDPNDPKKQPSHVLPCGTILNGKYITGYLLGIDHFDITYIGYDLASEKTVCIKEFFPSRVAMRSRKRRPSVLLIDDEHTLTGQKNLQAFIHAVHEMFRLRDLNHMVKVLDGFRENETAYVVMEYIEGETLQKHLDRTQSPLSEKVCLALMTPVMEDLSKAHARGIVHRGVSPQNMLLRPDGSMILKLGAFLTINMDYDPDLYDPDLDLLFYRPVPERAIEQYVSGGEIGPWTDVYGMCATIYRCVSGKSLATVLDRMEEDEKIDLSFFSSTVGQTLREGLAVKPKDRIQNMRELCQRLQSAALSAENNKLRPPQTVYVPHGLWRFFRRNR